MTATLVRRRWRNRNGHFCSFHDEARPSVLLSKTFLSLSHSLSSRENISEMMNWDVLSNFHINNFLRFFIFVLGLLWGRLQMKLRTLSTIPTFLTINFGLCRYFQKRESNPLPYLQQFARVIVFASINFRNNGASKIVKLRRQSNKYFFISKPTFEWISCSI